MTLQFHSIICMISGVTRPDISWAVGRMARESTAPTDRSWARLEGIAAYLENTADRKLTFRAGDAPGWDRLVIFCDSDWAGDPSYRSTTGALAFYNGAPIAWSSKLQAVAGRDVTALSSGEAEFYALATGTRMALGLRQQMAAIDDLPPSSATRTVVASGSADRIRTFAVWDDKPDVEVAEREASGEPTIVASDSQVALTMARNPTNKRSRHIGYRLQFVRDAVDYLQTRPHYVGTSSQPADLLTKPGAATSLDLHGDLLCGIGTCPQTRQLFPGVGA